MFSRKKHVANILEARESDEVKIGKGLNQELTLKRPGETHWSSHYHALANLTLIYSSIIEVIEIRETHAIAKKEGSSEYNTFNANF